MFHIVRWAVTASLSQGIVLIILALLLPGFDLLNLQAALLAGLVVSIIFVMFWPLAYSVAARIHPIFFPIFMFALSGLLILFTREAVNLVVSDGMIVESVWTALLISFGLTLGNTIAGALFSLNDQNYYDRLVTEPLRRQYRRTPRSDVPGLLFLEIDGLSVPVLQKAVAENYMPEVRSWLESGAYHVTEWETDLSSQTAASQAGILLGRNDNIPAYRWFDKPRSRLMVANKRETTRELEQELSTGQGLLANGGGSRWNFFSGDAVDCLGTFSKMGDPNAGGPVSYYAYFSSPYLIARTTGLFIAEVIRELVQSFAQRIHNKHLGGHRTIKFSLVRGVTNVILQETSVFMLTSDMFRGMPCVYNTFFGYDEVAHKSGIASSDAMKVLSTIDRALAHLAHVAAIAPRPYFLVVLSDHGQSQGAPFKQRYGLALNDLVQSLIENAKVRSPLSADEGLAELDAAFGEALRQDRPSARFVRRLINHSDSNMLPKDGSATSLVGDSLDQNVLVLASGNLATISFTQWSERLSLEQLNTCFPGLLTGLANHRGIGFVLVNSRHHGAVVIGKSGMLVVESGTVDGDNPLADYGSTASHHLLRWNSFKNAPDVLIMGRFDPDTGEIVAFEDLVGNHGGLGGPQTQPFVMYPSAFELDDERKIIGAEALHIVLKGWLAHIQCGHDIHESTVGKLAGRDNVAGSTDCARD